MKPEPILWSLHRSVWWRPLVLTVLTMLAAGAAVVSGAGPARADGGWLWPLAPRPAVVRGFEAPAGPYAPGHRGVDLLGVAGQHVLAVADATVAFAGRVAGIGVVSVDTAQGRVTYQPVVASVRRGDVVVAGQVLGELSTDGGHCLPRACLHLGLVVTDQYRDPLALLGGGPVRLLPVDGPLISTGPSVGPLATRSGTSAPAARPIDLAAVAAAPIEARGRPPAAVGSAAALAVGGAVLPRH